MERNDVLRRLEREKGDRSIREFAKALGVSAPYLSDVFLGRRDPGPTLLKRYGLVRRRTVTITYEKSKKEK